MTAAHRRVGRRVGVRKGVDLKDVDLMTETLGVARLGRRWAVGATMMTTTMIGRIVRVAVRQPADLVQDRVVRDACPDLAARPPSARCPVGPVGGRKGLAECLDSAALLDLAALAADLELADRALADAEVTTSMAASPTWNAG